MSPLRNGISGASLLLLGAIALILPLTGCSWVSAMGTDMRGAEHGITYYLGGAGYLGHVGSIDVPKGLRAGGYRGAIECFDWQSIFGGALRDEIDRERNEGQARRLAGRIQNYADRYPGRPINIIALSAGTGVTTWALEELPDDIHVKTVVFLGSSLAHRYNLSAALRHVDGQLISFYSDSDPILRYAVPLTGSVDREWEIPGGLRPFGPPVGAPPETRAAYEMRVRNIGYRKAFAEYGNYGGHIDATNAAFIERYVAPVINQQSAPRLESPASESTASESTAARERESAPVDSH